jgi:hypothetical protein
MLEILGAQIRCDHELDPKEIADEYLLMTQLDLNADARAAVRKYMGAHETDVKSHVDELLSKVDGEENEALKFSVVKDLIRVSVVDGDYSDIERKSIEETASLLFGNRAGDVIRLAEQAAKDDDDFLRGKFSTINEVLDKGKDLAAGAAAIGVPIAAVYFSGSVIGLSAVGITSGLATLGALGGATAPLWFNPMTAGIGVVVLLGVGTYSVVHYGFDSSKREREKKRVDVAPFLLTP